MTALLFLVAAPKLHTWGINRRLARCGWKQTHG